jgi:hypothetical protein
MSVAMENITSLHTVLRGGWVAESVVRERGEVLDTAIWARQQSVPQLIKTRYITPTNRDLTPTACECGRLWDSPESAELHRCPGRSTPSTAEGTEEKAPRKPRVSKDKD